MRKWTQKVKLTLSERITVEVEHKLREEIRAASADKKPFIDPLSDEQRQTVDDQTYEQLEKEIKETYNEVIQKAKFLSKLALPKQFIEVIKNE